MVYSSPIPQLGLGTFGRTGDAGIAAILKALEIGYRHIDTAQSYDTEGPVGEAVRRSGLPRAEVFVTTKVADTNLDKSRFMPSVEKSLETLGFDHVDLLLIHWPSEKDAVPFEDYMLALKEAQERGFTRFIGVSNFPIAHLERTRALLGEGAIATNQVEIHPYLQAPKLRDYARDHGLVLTAYQPLVKGAVVSDPVLAEIAERHGVTPAAVALAFLMAEGHAVIPASSSEANLRANMRAKDVRLSEEEMNAIRALDRGDRRINPEKSPRWDD
ncbi:aldo/keto reductase [Chelativorans sp. SCAU2101]|uniref:Aldo/keto reductase n=1 Tax=Chelativorans petroleitrophicus TaxID=2975484 RepID=A0A9X2XAH1_9HYPH|nr:aldo/keto reductase [Chelativorans petroleitrophicus]MCT8990452.1 aldo/keto reductase [Chelativorans petroleitrophicus]